MLHNNKPNYYYLINGGSSIKGVKTQVFSQVNVKSPNRGVTIVDWTAMPVFITLGEWAISTPTFYVIGSDKEIEGFDGKIVRLPNPPKSMLFIPEINSLMIDFSDDDPTIKRPALLKRPTLD